jgi:hypothetical protein
MVIPDPIANHGDTVHVRNYRSKPKDGSEVWERGVITELSYSNLFGHKWKWRYNVDLVRRSRTGNVVRLYVGNEDIETSY